MDAIGLLVEGGCLAYGAFTLSDWHAKQAKIQGCLKFLMDAAAMSPALLKKAMDGKAEFLVRDNILSFEQGKNYAKGMAMIRGKVDSQQSFKSILNQSTQLVLSLLSSEVIFSNNRNLEEAAGVTETKFVSEFELVDPALQNERVYVSNSSSVKFMSALQLVNSVVYMRSLSAMEKALSWMLFCVKLFLSASNVGKRLAGFKVGTKKVEKGIMLGQFIVAFGEVVFDKHTKELRMTNPLYFLKDKAQLIHRLRDKLQSTSKNSALLFGLVVFLGFLVARRLFKILKKLLEKNAQYRSMKNLDVFGRLKRIYTGCFRCALCTENVKNVVFKPCLHLAVCSTCFEKMTVKRCPSCQAAVEDKVRIYVV